MGLRVGSATKIGHQASYNFKYDRGYIKIGDVSNLNKKKIKYEQELKVVTELTEEYINKNKTTLQNQKEYNDK